MLIGSYSGRLSPKRRTAVPKKFLEELGNTFIIAKWYEGCLVIVGKSLWEALLERVTPRGTVVTGPVRDTDRFILGSAFEVSSDGQGRIVIPAGLASYANLSEKIVFLGLRDRVEVWDEEVWIKRETEIASHAAELIEKLAEKNDKS